MFPDKYMHMGGDEVNTDCWTQSPQISQWMNANNLTADQTYEYFVNRTHSIVAGLGRYSVVWEEVWNHFGTQLSPGTVIEAWLSTNTPPAVTAAGYQVIWAVDGRWYVDTPSRYDLLTRTDFHTLGRYLDGLTVTWQSMYDQDPLAGITSAAQQKLVLGGEGCMWGETVDQSGAFADRWYHVAWTISHGCGVQKQTAPRPSGRARRPSPSACGATTSLALATAPPLSRGSPGSAASTTTGASRPRQ